MNWLLPDNHDLGHLQGALKYVDNFACCVEAGAHRGIWTNQLVGYFQRVVAIEPGPLGGRIDCGAEVIQAAVGAHAGWVYMKDGTENSGQRHIDTSMTGTGRTPMIKIDDLDVTDVGFLKIDVEGYELFALQGAEQTIIRDHPVVLIEENGLCQRYEIDDGDACNFLLALGYQHVDTFNKDWVFQWPK